MAEYPEDEPANKHIIAVSSQGNVTSETPKTFMQEEAMDLIAEIPT